MDPDRNQPFYIPTCTRHTQNWYMITVLVDTLTASAWLYSHLRNWKEKKKKKLKLRILESSIIAVLIDRAIELAHGTNKPTTVVSATNPLAPEIWRSTTQLIEQFRLRRGEPHYTNRNRKITMPSFDLKQETFLIYHQIQVCRHCHNHQVNGGGTGSILCVNRTLQMNHLDY